MLLISVTQATRYLVHRTESAERMETGKEWHLTAVCILMFIRRRQTKKQYVFPRRPYKKDSPVKMKRALLQARIVLSVNSELPTNKRLIKSLPWCLLSQTLKVLAKIIQIWEGKFPRSCFSQDY